MSETKRVEIKTRNDLAEVHVRALNSIEAIDMHDRLTSIESKPERVAEQLATMVSKADGTPWFENRAQALAFMASARPNVIAKLMKAATKFNELGDEAIEDELKN